MSDEHVDDLLELYALGTLEPDEQTAVERHLATCAQCQARLAEAQRLIAMIAVSAPQHEPPPQLRARILSQVEPRQAATPKPRSWWRRLIEARWTMPRVVPLLGGALALLLILGLGARTVQLQRALNNEIATRQALQQRILTLQSDLAEQQRLVAVLRSPQTRVVALTTQDNTIAGYLLLTPDSEIAYFSPAALPALPNDRTYQLWLIATDQPESAGVFRPDQQNGALVPVQAQRPLGQYRVVGISVEPAGGSPQPTTTPIVLTELQS